MIRKNEYGLGMGVVCERNDQEKWNKLKWNEETPGKAKPALPPSTWRCPHRLFNDEPNQERIRHYWGLWDAGLDSSLKKLRMEVLNDGRGFVNANKSWKMYGDTDNEALNKRNEVYFCWNSGGDVEGIETGFLMNLKNGGQKGLGVVS